VVYVHPDPISVVCTEHLLTERVAVVQADPRDAKKIMAGCRHGDLWTSPRRSGC
jgi:hypothetical protein